MSTIINVLANQGLFDDASTDDHIHNTSAIGGGGLYNVISQGLHYQDAANGANGRLAFSTTLSPNTPSLQNLAPELNDLSINRLKFIVLGVIGSMLAVLGFLGNTMSMVVLQQRQMRSSTSYYLLSLAIYDNLVLLSMLLYFIIPALAINIPAMAEYLATYSITEPVGYPLSLTAQMGSIYTCVGFTVERFIAVCRPLQVANTCTKSRTIRAIVLIFVWSVLYNIPRFFHLHAVYFYPDSEAPPTGSVMDSTTAGLMTVLSTSSSHQNASLSQLSFRSSVPSGFPCGTEGRGGEGLSLLSSLSSSSSSSSSSNADSSYNGLTLPCIHNDNAYDITSSFSSPSKLSLPPSFSSPSSSSSSISSSLLSSLLKSSSAPSHQSSVITPKSAAPTKSTLPISTTTTSPSSIDTPPPDNDIKYVKALPTTFGSDPIFRNLYLIYSQLFFMFLLPFLIILFMNIGLIRAVKRSKAMQQRMGTSASARKERNLTVMLIAVIVVFLVCQFPTIIDNILIAVFGAPRLYPDYQYQCFYTACTLMVLINSASNFLLYCFFGKKFRVVLLSLLGIKKRQQYVAYRSTMYRSRSNGSRACDIEMSVV